jgi:uncharacterized protein YutE (UPF0331/DUF86 family)
MARVIGTRVILAHAYFHVDQDIIGDELVGCAD